MLRDPQLPDAVAVVCYDAGACNLILPWLHRPGLRVRAVMQGPALELWRHRFGNALRVGSIEQALSGVQLVLTGTGWASTLEHDARVLAQQRNLRCAAVIDHWVNYPERFVFKGLQQWPEEFWLTDDLAFSLARMHFPTHRLRCYANRYLQQQAQAVLPLRAGHGDVLVVMEPARSDWGRGEPGEFQALDWFMASRQAAGMGAPLRVRLRPHPSDPPGKYGAWLACHPGVVLDTHSSLALALNEARYVVGCESQALVVALAAGRQVFSCLPPWAPACRLPHPGVQRLALSGPLGSLAQQPAHSSPASAAWPRMGPAQVAPETPVDAVH
jgi:hypothetical protein